MGIVKGARNSALHQVIVLARQFCAVPCEKDCAQLALFWLRSQFRMKIVKVTHWLVVVLFGLELLPTIIARKLALTHMDYVVECLLFRFVDQVRICRLLPA